MGYPRTVTERGVATVGVPLLPLIEGVAGNAEMPTGVGHAPALTDAEWFVLMENFSEIVLRRHRMAGEEVGASLIDVLDEERERRNGP